ncbi:hypothetical protein [Derxia gummosa]|uniref:Uncharacterized protein n=1 Tax=Derxia gummosa DSM 723 TaxID=1121388 RepID=A0A8B6X3M5_9BURK|nr:hypothetical protein [Derxia gummosa]
MPTFKVITAVHLNDLGEVERVRWCDVDGQTKRTVSPDEVVDVIAVVDLLMRGDRVFAVLPGGQLGPELKVTLSKRGHGEETIEFVQPAPGDAGHSITEMERF